MTRRTDADAAFARRLADRLGTTTETVRYGYGAGGHEFDPERGGRCRKAASGYCDGTRADSAHEMRTR